MGRLWRKARIRLADDQRRADFFRAEGAKIGRGCRILTTNLGSEPYLISIGDETLVAPDVVFVTHDAGTWVFRKEHPKARRLGRVTVGSRCFIGTRAILLPGVKVGDRSIVAAGAVVSRDVPPGTVVAGVPARVLGTTEDYMRRTLEEHPLLDVPAPGVNISPEERRRQIEEHYPPR